MAKLLNLHPYFFSPSLHTLVTLGNKLLVEKAVEKMNLRYRHKNKLLTHFTIKKRTHCAQAHTYFIFIYKYLFI